MEWVKLGDIFEFIRNGANIKQIDGNGIPITRIETISNGEINLNRVGYANIKYPEYEDYYLRDGDILMSHINSEKHLGKTALFTKNLTNMPLIHGMNLLCLRPKKEYIPMYLKYFFNSKIFKAQIRKISKSSVNQSSFNISDLKKLRAPILNYEEQLKIVKKLYSIDKISRIRKEQIQAYDDLIESLFFDIFGDIRTNEKNIIKKTMGDVLTVNQGLQIPISKRLKNEEKNSYKYITIKYLNGNSNPEYIKDPNKSVICNEDDILVTRTGNTGQIVTNVSGVFHNNFFKLNYDRTMFNKYYLDKYLNTNYVQNIMKLKAGTSTIPDLNHGDFYKIDVLIPPIEIQNKFADYVVKIEEEKKKLNASLNELEILFDGLMQDAFSGNLFKE